MKGRIRDMRKKLRMSQTKLAKKMQTSMVTIRRYESGETMPDAGFLKKLISLFNVNPTWLLTGEQEMFLSVQERRSLKIPVISFRVSAKFPKVIEDEQIQDYLHLPSEEVFRIDSVSQISVFVMKVQGRNMSPVVRDKEYVVFLSADADSVNSGDIVVVKNEWNELILKRFRAKYGESFLLNDNPEYIEIVKPDKEYTVVGKVIKKVTVQDS